MTRPLSLTCELVDLQLELIDGGQLVLLILVNIAFFCQLCNVLDVVGFLGELLGIIGRVTDVKVVDYTSEEKSQTPRKHL